LHWQASKLQRSLAALLWVQTQQQLPTRIHFSTQAVIAYAIENCMLQIVNDKDVPENNKWHFK
jgi:multidrug resistance efflux pump